MQTAKFIVPKNISLFDPKPVARPVGKTASYLCQVAKRSELSITELYVLEKMGFRLEIKYEGKSRTLREIYIRE